LLNAILSLLVSLVLFNSLQLYLYLQKDKNFIKRQKLTVWQSISLILSVFLIFVGCLLYTSSHWVMTTMGNVRFDQIIYVMSQPLTGTDPDKIKDFIVGPLLSGVF